MSVLQSLTRISICVATLSLSVTGCAISESGYKESQVESAFENRPFVFTRPTGEVKGVLFYLHGASVKPWEETEGRVGVRKFAESKGYVVVQPTGDISCSTLGIKGAGERLCWNLRDISGEMVFLGRLVDHLEEVSDGRFETRAILGYSNGGYLLGGALQRGLGGAWDKVGIIAGGALGAGVALKSPGPEVHIEIGTNDRWQLLPSRRLRDAIGQVQPTPVYRETSDGHDLSEKRVHSFLTWWLESLEGEPGKIEPGQSLSPPQ